MKHMQDYQVILSDQNIPVFILNDGMSEPKNPIILYDGGQHATLFRSDDDVVLIDYIPKEIVSVLQNIDWVVVMEKNHDQNDIIRDYKVYLKKIKNNPFIDNLPK